jgi:HK97 family phage major capsid protein/HK97 family phage prohead protease
MSSDRIRKLSFSSEQAVVQRWFGGEILDHSPSSVRMDFINSGRAPLLLNHDSYSQPIGVIEAKSVAIGKDKVGRASVRFGRTGDAVDALTNVDDGILANTSVGYKVHEMRFDSEQNGEETYRVIDWEPYEVSLVGVPADRSVGIGRGNDVAGATQRGVQMSETEAGAAGSAAAGGSGADAARAAAAAEATRLANGGADAQARIEVVRHEQQQRSAAELEKARVKVIDTLCKANKIDDRLRTMWITSGADVEKVADDILNIVKTRGDVKPTSAAELGLSEQETERFSLCKAILAVRDKDWSNAGFEAECSRAIANKLGKPLDPMRFYVPYEVQQRRSVSPAALQMHARSRMAGATDWSRIEGVNQHLTRADVVGTTTAGGYLVETINLSFIELLRNRTVLFRLGATVLSGLVGNVNIPKQTGAATAMWLSSETTQITEVEQTFGQLAFSPHTVGGYTEISRLLLLQSSPDIEGIVNADLAAIVGIAVDLAGLNGSGASGQPHGVIGLAGVGTGTGTTIGLGGLLTAQASVGAANVVPVRGGWASTFTVSSLLRQRVEFTNTYSPLWYGSIWDGVMVGYPALASNQIPSGDLIFGDWAQIVVAEWGVLEVEVNPYANFQAGIIGVRAIMTVDIGVRYPGAFYVTTAVT